MKLLVCYDIECPRVRYRVAKCLLNFGARIQKSVFECVLDEVGLRSLDASISELLLDRQDSILLFRLDTSGPRPVRSWGKPYNSRGRGYFLVS